MRSKIGSGSNSGAISKTKSQAFVGEIMSNMGSRGEAGRSNDTIAADSCAGICRRATCGGVQVGPLPEKTWIPPVAAATSFD